MSLLISSVLTAPENHILLQSQMENFSVQKSVKEPPPLRLHAPSCPPGAQVHQHPNPFMHLFSLQKATSQQLLVTGKTILGKSSHRLGYHIRRKFPGIVNFLVLFLTVKPDSFSNRLLSSHTEMKVNIFGRSIKLAFH